MEPAIQNWLFESLASALATAFEAMAGDKPAIQWQVLDVPALQRASQEDLIWRQTFHGVPGAAWISAAMTDWMSAAQQILRAAGLEESERSTLKSTFLDLLSRSMAVLAEHLAVRFGSEVECAQSEETSEQRAKIQWALMRLALLGTTAVEISVGADGDLLTAVLSASQAPAASTVPKTLDLLLDVELPVSVSFGRAQIALKDVLKLTTGSILELDRTIAEPVEIIVNNCAIARGEVVVVEGNFGVRVLQVISRQERLITLS